MENLDYTPAILFLLGLLGVALHNLVEMNKLNKAAGGEINVVKYWKLERFSIIISILVVVGCVVCAHEIEQLEHAGKMLGVGFVTIGYMGQSLLVAFMGKASDKVK